MQAIILNSGTGSRMGDLTKDIPKCLLPIAEDKTILTEQIESLNGQKVNEIIITTGKHHDKIKSAVDALNYNMKIIYVKNEEYAVTNYIYSLYLTRGLIKSDIILLHGDLVFEKALFSDFVNDAYGNLVLVSNSAQIPAKDFKARIEGGFVKGISVNYKENCKFCLPMYKLTYSSAMRWFDEIEIFIRKGLKTVYAEEAFNMASIEMKVKPFYFDAFCMEVDDFHDYEKVKALESFY